MNIFYDVGLDSREWYQHPHTVSRYMAKPFLYSPGTLSFSILLFFLLPK